MPQENAAASTANRTLSTALSSPAVQPSMPGLPVRPAGERPQITTTVCVPAQEAARGVARSAAATVTSRRFGRIWYVPTAAIHPGPTQMRKRLAADELQALAASLREKGMAQPVLLRVRREAADQFELIAGYRRWQAAILADMAEVPAILIDKISDREAFEFALVENLQRRDLTLIEEAEALRLMTEGYGRTHEQVAALTGRSRSQVSNILRLLGLPQEVKEMIEAGHISFGHARALLATGSPAELAARITEERLTVRETERIVHATDAADTARRDTPSTTARPETDSPAQPAADAADLEALTVLQAEIAQELGSIVEIKLDGKRPVIRIHTRSPREAEAAARTIRDALQLLSMSRAMRSLG